jgi:lipoprotein-anchoring transpeptidase ErfK/SrfK
MDLEEKYNNKKGYFFWSIPLILFLLFLLIIFDSTGVQNGFFAVKSWFTPTKITAESSLEGIEKQELKSQRSILTLQSKLTKMAPNKPYIVINTTDNRFSLRYPNGDTIRTGPCSTGKDNILIKGNKKWVFKTPKGLFTILNKRTSPVWTKPDWAFVEEGLPIPAANAEERYDYSTMGDYALGLGNGYYLHGTLYQRFLGLPVTHGCVRIGSADLQVIYNTLEVGSKVFIY